MNSVVFKLKNSILRFFFNLIDFLFIVVRLLIILCNCSSQLSQQMAQSTAPDLEVVGNPEDYLVDFVNEMDPKVALAEWYINHGRNAIPGEKQTRNFGFYRKLLREYVLVEFDLNRIDELKDDPDGIVTPEMLVALKDDIEWEQKDMRHEYFYYHIRDNRTK